ncbi:MAG: NAD(P)-dependent oxidoreductase [Deltaproteobacteria bacterium]|nr:NAD(P)-dependent oxidoreductase [Deltaproteobacteria bacterium]
MVALRRLLLLGGSGRLGSHLRRAAGDDLRVAVAAPSRDELDLETASQEELDSLVGSGLYDVVLNCSAIALVDRCETERALADRINGVVPGMLATAAAKADVPFVHISTDYVFGGEAAPVGPFAETTPVGPAQYYGVTKAAGEEAVLAVPGRRTVARVSWLFGDGATPFQDYVLARARSLSEVPLLDQASRPTWLPGLSLWLLNLAAALQEGAFAPNILHPAGGPAATRHEWARAILDAHGLADVPTVPQTVESAPLAPRPKDTRLDARRTDAWIEATWGATLPDWREMVERAAR